MTTKKNKKSKAKEQEELEAAQEQANGEGAPDKAAQAPDSAKEIEELKKELLYQAAELENFKRRTEKRYRDALEFAAEPVVKDLLPVLDNLERAAEHAAETSESIAEGLGHIVEQFQQTLARQGVAEVDAMGEKFDPNFHEALTQIPGEEDNKVVAVHEKGYAMKGRLLRPAKVVVSRLATK